MYKATAISLLLALFAVASATHLASVQRHHLRKSIRATAVAIDQAHIDAMVDAHNKVRDNVAAGKVNGKDGALPTAADMIELQWNADLAAHAQAYANTLISPIKSVEDQRAKVGPFIYVSENMFEYHFDEAVGLGNWTVAVDSWAAVAANLPKAEVGALFGSDAAEFTNIAWSLTAFIGCGAAQYPNGTDSKSIVVVCQYGPGGNVAGSAVYNAGKPQSKCKFGASTKYANLCNSGKPKDNTGAGTPAAAPSTEADLPPVGPAPVGPVANGTAAGNGSANVNTTTNTTVKPDGETTTTTTTVTDVEGEGSENVEEEIEGEAETAEGELENTGEEVEGEAENTGEEVENTGEEVEGEAESTEEGLEGEAENTGEEIEGEAENAEEGAENTGEELEGEAETTEEGLEGEAETEAEVEGEVEAGSEEEPVEGEEETTGTVDEEAPGDAEAGMDIVETDEGEGENGDSNKEEGLGDAAEDATDSLATDTNVDAGAEIDASGDVEPAEGEEGAAAVEADLATDANAEVAARMSESDIKAIERIGAQIKPISRRFKDATYFRHGLAKVMDRKH